MAPKVRTQQKKGGDWQQGDKQVERGVAETILPALIRIMGADYDVQAFHRLVLNSNPAIESTKSKEQLDRTLSSILSVNSDDIGSTRTTGNVESFATKQAWLEALVENLGAEDHDPFLDALPDAEKEELAAAERCSLLCFPKSSDVKRVRVPRTNRFTNHYRRVAVLSSVTAATGMTTRDISSLWGSQLAVLDSFVVNHSGDILNRNLPALTDDDESFIIRQREKDRRIKLLNDAKRNEKKRLNIRVELFKALKKEGILSPAVLRNCQAKYMKNN